MILGFVTEFIRSLGAKRHTLLHVLPRSLAVLFTPSLANSFTGCLFHWLSPSLAVSFTGCLLHLLSSALAHWFLCIWLVVGVFGWFLCIWLVSVYLAGFGVFS